MDLHSGKIFQIQKELLSYNITPETVNRRISVINAILNFSVNTNRLPFNPIAGYQKLKVDKMPMDFWNESEAVRFLESMDRAYPSHSKKRWIYVVYLLAINTGLRPGEIWGLFPSDLSHEDNTLRISRQYDRVLKALRTTKSKRPRIVPCNVSLRNELVELIRKSSTANNKPIFLNGNRTPISHDNFAKRQFKRDLENSGVRPIRFHCLRHTAGTLMVANGIDIMTVKEIFGHSNIKTTMNYVHLVAKNIQNVAKNFNITPQDVGSVTQLRALKQ